MKDIRIITFLFVLGLLWKESINAKMKILPNVITDRSTYYDAIATCDFYSLVTPGLLSTKAEYLESTVYILESVKGPGIWVGGHIHLTDPNPYTVYFPRKGFIMNEMDARNISVWCGNITMAVETLLHDPKLPNKTTPWVFPAIVRTKLRPECLSLYSFDVMERLELQGLSTYCTEM